MKRLRLLHAVLIGLLTVLLSACPGSDTPTPLPGGTTLSGTVMAPAGGDVLGTLVVACIQVGQACDPQQSRTVSIAQAGPSALFNLEVSPGVQYTLIAVKDINVNNTTDAGDYQGFYTLDGQNAAPVTAPAANLMIQMAIVGGTPPPPPPGQNDLSGTVSAPQGGDVSGTRVVACFVENNACNTQSPNTKVTQISTAGSSAPFTISALAAGSYIIGAVKDVNGDQEFNAGDYSGCYGGAQCSVVTPPQTGLNVQLEIEGGGGGGTGAGTIIGTLIFPGDRGAATASSAQLRSERSVPRTAKGEKIIPGEVIVKFAPQRDARGQVAPLSRLALAAKLRDYRFQGRALQIERPLAVSNSGLYRVLGLNAAETLKLAAELDARPDVLYAEPNVMVYALATPDDPFYGAQWHYPAINLPNAWNIEDGTSNPVTVAVIDTGGIPHPDLEGVLVGGYDFISDPQNGGDGDGRDADPTDLGQDSGYHGPHVAGTVAAKTNNGVGLSGVSWGAKVVPVRALGVTGSGSLADIADAILWSAGLPVDGVPNNPNPAKIVNLSLGGEGDCAGVYQDAFNALKTSGVVAVVAAGNEDEDASSKRPANCQNVITVGATGPDGTRAPYSNYGTTVDVMAPGGDSTQTIEFDGRTFPAHVYSTAKDGDTGEFIYSGKSGTSMATPHVAGVVALMLAKDPTLTPDAVLAQLKASATPLSTADCKRPDSAECGAGLIDAVKALGTGGTPPPPPPPPPPTGSLTTYVAALFCTTTNPCRSFDTERSQLVVVEADLLEKPFTIEGLEPGSYVAAAWQDLNEDSEINEREPFGRHRNDLTVAAGQTVDRADIYLEPTTVDPAARMGFERQFRAYLAAKDAPSLALSSLEFSELLEPETSLLRSAATGLNSPGSGE